MNELAFLSSLFRQMARRLSMATSAALCAGLLFAMPDSGLAQSDDAVVVSPAAGTDSAVVYSLDRTGGKATARRTGRRTLVAGDLAPSSFTDFKVLVGGGNLLADFGDRGVGITDAAGALEFQLAAPGDRAGVASAAVAGYDSANHADRLLVGDDDNQAVEIYDQQLQMVVWSKKLKDPAAPAEITQVVALPNHRIAIGMNWRSLQVTGIDVVDLTAKDPKATQLRFANEKHPGAPAGLVTDSSLFRLTDLSALGPDRLLATTESAVLEISLPRQSIETRLTINDHQDFAGEFIAARKLPSGEYAVATVEPGVWSGSHPNHRVYWLDSSFSTVVAKTPALATAPWRLDAAKGHGASGTSGFEPDLSFLPTAKAGDLETTSPPQITPNPTQIGTTSVAEVELRNPASRPVYLASAAIRANPKSCDASGAWRTLIEETGSAMRAGAKLKLKGAFAIPEEEPTGTWCAKVRVEDREGAVREFDATRKFEVGAAGADASTGTGRGVDPVDLGLRYVGDAGPPTGGADVGVIERPEKGGGCGCAGASSSAGTGELLLFAIAGLLGALRRRRRVHGETP